MKKEQIRFTIPELYSNLQKLYVNGERIIIPKSKSFM